MMIKKRQIQISILLILLAYASNCCSGFTPSPFKSWSSSMTIDTKTCLEIKKHIRPHRVALQHPQLSFPSLPPTTLSLSEQDDDAVTDGNTISLLGTVGIACQPIVWISLGFAANTGAGLPAGPFGLLGAVEGLSYLIVVGLVALNILVGGGREEKSDASLETAQKLSSFTLLAALLTLLSLVKDQGCVPNAKPILDYSDYLPVCNPEDTPGLFGS